MADCCDASLDVADRVGGEGAFGYWLLAIGDWLMAVSPNRDADHECRRDASARGNPRPVAREAAFVSANGALDVALDATPDGVGRRRTFGAVAFGFAVQEFVELVVGLLRHWRLLPQIPSTRRADARALPTNGLWTYRLGCAAARRSLRGCTPRSGAARTPSDRCRAAHRSRRTAVRGDPAPCGVGPVSRTLLPRF